MDLCLYLIAISLSLSGIDFIGKQLKKVKVKAPSLILTKGLKYEKNELIKPYFTTKKRRGGSGLGLAIVEKILFDHNAEFFIENRNDGTEGAKVEIKFNNKI